MGNFSFCCCDNAGREKMSEAHGLTPSKRVILDTVHEEDTEETEQSMITPRKRNFVFPDTTDDADKDEHEQEGEEEYYDSYDSEDDKEIGDIYANASKGDQLVRITAAEIEALTANYNSKYCHCGGTAKASIKS